MKRWLNRFSLIIVAMILLPQIILASLTYHGSQILVEEYDGGLHYTILMATPGFDWKCRNLKFKGSPVTDGHWRNYAPWGNSQGSIYYQLTKTFYLLWLPFGSSNPANYTAECNIK